MIHASDETRIVIGGVIATASVDSEVFKCKHKNSADVIINWGIKVAWYCRDCDLKLYNYEWIARGFQ